MSLESFQNKTDEQLMKLYQNGDDSAFKVLYERHANKIYGFLSKRIKNKENVNQIFQEVFVKIHKSKVLYKDSLPLLPWIFTITKSVMLDQWRKEKNFPIVDIDVLDSALESVQAITETHSQKDLVGLVSQLPDQQRQAIEMRYINDKTFDEIAESLKINPANARQIISRGLKRLRELIGDGEKS